MAIVCGAPTNACAITNELHYQKPAALPAEAGTEASPEQGAPGETK